MRIRILFQPEDSEPQMLWYDDATEADLEALSQAIAGDPATILIIPNLRVQPDGPAYARMLRAGRIVGIATEC